MSTQQKLITDAPHRLHKLWLIMFTASKSCVAYTQTTVAVNLVSPDRYRHVY